MSEEAPRPSEAREIYRVQSARQAHAQRLLVNRVPFYVEVRGRTVEYICLCCQGPGRVDAEAGVVTCGDCRVALDLYGARFLAQEARKALRVLVRELDLFEGRSWLWRVLFSR